MIITHQRDRTPPHPSLRPHLGSGYGGQERNRQQCQLNKLEGIARAQARLLELGSREGQRILKKVPPRARFSTLEANQQTHRVPNLLTFQSAADLATTLASAFGVPRFTIATWAATTALDTRTPWLAPARTLSSCGDG